MMYALETDEVENTAIVQVGDILVYEITYKNGHSAAANITITDVLDAFKA